MATKQELQESIKKMVVVANNPKTSESIRKTLLKSIEKAENQLKELEKAETLEKKEELTEKQEQKVEEVKEESKELVKSLKAKIKSSKSGAKSQKATPPSSKFLQKAKELAKKYRAAQKGVPTGASDIERDAGRPALPKGKRTAKESGKTYYENRENRIDRKQPPKRYPKLADGGMMAKGGEISSFEKKIKDALKEENKWHFINEEVDGKNVQLKMFVGKKEVDVQIFRINGIGAKMPRNYVGKRETLKMIMENFEPKMAEGGETSDDKIRFDMYGYIHANDQTQDGDEIIRVSSYKEAEEKAEKYLKENKYELVELYRKDDFVGSMRTKKNFVYSSRYKKEDFADGGMMAKGGEINVKGKSIKLKYVKRCCPSIKNDGTIGNYQYDFVDEMGNPFIGYGNSKEEALKSIEEYQNRFASGGYMADGGVIFLKSVSTYFRPSDMTVSSEKSFKNEGEIISLNDVDEEWINKLSVEDNKTIFNAMLSKHYKDSKGMADGGMMARGGKEKYNLSFNYNPSNLSNKDAEKIVSRYTKNWRHDNDFDEVSFFVMGLSKSDADSLAKELKMENTYNVEIEKSKYADGGETDINEIEVGDYVNFGQYGNFYVVNTDYLGGDTHFWVTKEKENRTNSQATGYSMFKSDAKYIIEKYKDADGGEMARGGGVGDNVLGLNRGDIYKVIDKDHTETGSDFVFLDYVEIGKKIGLKSLRFPINFLVSKNKLKDDVVSVMDITSDGIKLLTDEQIADTIRRNYKSKTPEFEYGGVLLPMTGGVNADPRFDIYNTGAFMKKGGAVKRAMRFEDGGMNEGGDNEFLIMYRSDNPAYQGEDGFEGNPPDSMYADSAFDVLDYLRENMPDDVEVISIEEASDVYKKGGYMAKGGSLQSIKNKYEENEDKNAHSENVVLLAKHFGTKEDLSEAKKILSIHNKEGHLSTENGQKRRELHLKLIEKAREQMSKEGIEFEYGGILQPMTGGVNADPRFDIYDTGAFMEKGGKTAPDDFADGGILSNKVGTIETADYNQYTGKLKDIREQIIELNFGNIKGKETNIYATVEDENGVDRRGVIIEIFEDEKLIGHSPEFQSFAKGGIYSSDSLYLLKVSKDGQEVGQERFRAKNLREAKEIGEEFEEKYKSKFGDNLSFSVKEAENKMNEGGLVKVKWSEAEYGDSARVIAENKMGLILKPYGQKFHLKFPDGTEKTYTAKELEFYKEEEYKHGGNVKEHSQNLEMLENQAKEFKHHAEELQNVLKSNPEVDAWVVAKAERATTDLSDITHYLDGLKKKMADGGSIPAGYHMMPDGTIMPDSAHMKKGGQVKLKEDIFYLLHYMLLERKLTTKNVELVKKEVLKNGNNEQKELAKQLTPPTIGKNEKLISLLDKIYWSLKNVKDSYAEGGMMDKGGKIYKIQVKDSHDIKPKWEDDTWHTGGKKYLSFKDAQIAVKKLQGDTAYAHKQFKVVEDKEKMAMGGKVKKDFNVGDKVIFAKGGKWFIRNKENFHKGEISKIEEIGSLKVKNYTIDRKNKFGNVIETYTTSDLKEIEIDPDNNVMAKGGKVKFADKVASIKKSLFERKKVPKAVQKDYGKTFSPAEAEDSAKRIVGAQTYAERIKYLAKKNKKRKN